MKDAVQLDAAGDKVFGNAMGPIGRGGGGEGRLAAWKEEEERKLRPVDRQHLEEEARRVTRKLKLVGRRLEEEQVVKEEMKAREKEGKIIKERLEEDRRVEESERAARNREWRMKRETEGSRKEGEKAGSLEEVLVAELVCTNCQTGLWNGPIHQCIDGPYILKVKQFADSAFQG